MGKITSTSSSSIMSAYYGVTHHLYLPLLLLLFLLFSPNAFSYSDASTTLLQGNGSAEMMGMVPLMEPKKVVEMRLMLNESNSRRRLNGFQICALCTCCGGAKGLSS